MQIDSPAELERQENLGELAGAYLMGDTARIEEIAAMRGIDLGVLNLILHCTLGPVLARVALKAGITGDDFGVNEGTCPVWPATLTCRVSICAKARHPCLRRRSPPSE